MHDPDAKTKSPDAVSPENSGVPGGFWSLFVTQFQGAFSDNAYKFLVMFLVMRSFAPEQQDQLVPLVGALFAIPFLLFSMAGGYLADRYSKRAVTIGTKAAEIATMTLATAGLYSGNIPLLLGVVFLMSTQSAFFGPTKYGLLPELLPESRLSWGNGTLSLGTFVAIIAGTVAAGWLSEEFHQQQGWSGIVLVALAGLGLVSSLGIPKVPAANVHRKFRLNLFQEIGVQMRGIKRDQVLMLAVVGGAYFLFFGALLQQTILIYGEEVLQVDDKIKGYLQAALAIGIGVGSMAAGYLSGRKIEYGLIPLGAIGITAASILMSREGLSTMAVGWHLAALGFSGGFYIVPINALIQHRPEPGQKGGAIATNAFFSWLGVLAAAGVYFVLAAVFGVGPRGIFLMGGILTLAGTLFVVRLLPDSLMRLVFWFLTHSLYRIRVDGRENIPERNGALFVCNHLSLVDGFLLQASTDRPIRFMIFQGMYEKWWIRPVARALRFIPISSQLRPRDMLQSLRTASDAIRQGGVVCIFAEGQVTRIGQMLPFRRGFERIMKGIDAPIIPIHLDGAWGSVFSFAEGRFYWKWPKRIPYPITVTYGRPMPSTANALEARQKVQELGATAWRHRKGQMRPIHRQFVSTARRHPWRFGTADDSCEHRLGQSLARTLLIGRRLREIWAADNMIGILAHPSTDAAYVTMAALLAGKIPVHLDPTWPVAALSEIAQQCGISRVIVAELSGDRPVPDLSVEFVRVGNLTSNPRRTERWLAVLAACFAPVRLVERWLGRARNAVMDETATVIFPDNAAGNLTGVVLSHFNITANVNQISQAIALDARDRILGILPFSQALGFTATMCLPLTSGMGVVFHSDPRDTRGIGQKVQRYSITFLLAAPALLEAYLKGCTPEQFGSIKMVMTGGDPLTRELETAFEDKFGIHPFEGYGCPECSPVVAVSTRDYRSTGFRQVGAKRGSIGHPLPGVSVRVVNPDTKELAATGDEGVLLISGPNVMQGYLDEPERTSRVLNHGWFVTGHRAKLDEDGFLTVTRQK